MFNIPASAQKRAKYPIYEQKSCFKKPSTFEMQTKMNRFSTVSMFKHLFKQV